MSNERTVIPQTGYAPPQGKVELTPHKLVAVDADVIFYGPHRCEKCGKLICRTPRETGDSLRGIAFEYPEGPIYPNTQWQAHNCVPLVPHATYDYLEEVICSKRLDEKFIGTHAELRAFLRLVMSPVAPSAWQALRDVMGLIENHELIKNTVRDSETDWLARHTRLVMILKRAQEALQL